MRYFRYTVRVLACVLLCSLSTLICRAQDKPSEKIDIPDWKTLSAAYAYDNKKPTEVKEEEKKSDSSYLLHISFAGSKGDKVYGIFARPKKEGVYPTVLLLHGLTSDKETMVKAFGSALIAKGFAVLALDAPHHGERKMADENQQSPDTFASAVREGCLDYRRALDWLIARKDVDARHIGLIGYSMGSFMGAILGGVDDRIGAFALCVGGDPIITFVPQVPETLRVQIFTICPSLYVDHIAPRPLLMLNGKGDRTVVETASKRLYDAARDPKEQIWYESGHILPPAALDKCVIWMGEKIRNEKKADRAETKSSNKTDPK